jgi:hypothetical protein
VNQLRYVLLVVTLMVLVGVSALALDVPHAFVAGELVSAAEMNANFAAVAAAVTALEAEVATLRTQRPVVAHASVAGLVFVTGQTGVAMDLVSVQITVPATGYVVVEAAGQIAYWGSTQSNVTTMALGTAAGGYLDIISSTVIAVGDEKPGDTLAVYAPVSLRRVFPVQAGTHTFRWKAMDFSQAGNKYVAQPSVTATWYPAATVSIAVASAP